MRTKRWILWGVLAAGLALNIGLYFLLIFPQMQEDFRLASAVKELERKKLEAADQPEPSAVEYEQVLQLKKQLPLAQEHFSFLQQLQQLEQESQVIIQSITDAVRSDISTNELEQGIYTESFHVSLKGPYEGIEQFVQSLYQLERMIEITKWDLKADMTASVRDDSDWSGVYDTANGDQPLVHAAITMRLYFTDDNEILFANWPSDVRSAAAASERPLQTSIVQ